MAEELWLEPIEDALRRLGRMWPGAEELLRDCAALRTRLGKLEGIGSTAVTVAFVGPKNSGKTTVLSTLVGDEALAKQLPIGVAARGATDKLLWMGSEAPPGLVPEEEHFLPAGAGALRDLGFPAALLDTPGFDEGRITRSARAVAALDSAAVVVLVVRRTQLEQGDIPRYLESARGAHVLPVVTLVDLAERGVEEEVKAFVAGLRARFPESTIHAPIRVQDFELRTSATLPGQVLETVGRELRAALSGIVQGRSQRELTALERENRILAFTRDVAGRVRRAFPAAGEIAEKLADAQLRLPERVLFRLLGTDEEAARGIRHRLRMSFLERTPAVFFPWRALCSLGAWTGGAWDRLPGLCVGSLPSLLGTGLAVARNVRDARSFAESYRDGIQQRARELCREELNPLVDEFERALRHGLPVEPDRVRRLPANVRLHGMEALQRESTAIIERVTGEAALGRRAALFWAVFGTGIFWGIAIWPLIAVYTDYLSAIGRQWTPGATLNDFPAPGPGMWLTTLLLALLPTGLLSLSILGWVNRPSRVNRAISQIRDAHQAAAMRLMEKEALRMELSHPMLDAFIVLLSVPGAPRGGRTSASPNGDAQ